MTPHGYHLIEMISSFPTGHGISAKIQIGKDWALLPDYLQQPQLSSRMWAVKRRFPVLTAGTQKVERCLVEVPGVAPVIGATRRKAVSPAPGQCSVGAAPSCQERSGVWEPCRRVQALVPGLP